MMLLVVELFCKFVDILKFMSARLTFVLIFLIVIVFFGCKKENESKPIDYQYSYFPLNNGNELIYQVVDITIDKNIGEYDTLTYQLKERIDSMFIDNSGNKAWRLERYKRLDSTQNWVISDVWMSQIADHKAQQVEENQRFIKIVFPPEVGKKWNGNVCNTLDAQNFEITALDAPLSLNDFYFDSVLTVVQKYDTSKIHKYYTIEQYANYTGLVNKQIISIDYAFIEFDTHGILLPIIQRISRGHLYYQTLIKK